MILDIGEKMSKILRYEITFLTCLLCKSFRIIKVETSIPNHAYEAIV